MIFSAFRQWRLLKRDSRRGQTMTEYAIVLAAIAIAVFVAYQTLGQSINSLTTWQVDKDLTSAS